MNPWDDNPDEPDHWAAFRSDMRFAALAIVVMLLMILVMLAVKR